MKPNAEIKHWRLVWYACLWFVAVGYAIFLLAAYLPAPVLGKEVVAYLSDLVKALRTAVKVAALDGSDPFPVQVIILYCAFGSILLAGWCLYWGCLLKESRRSYAQKASNANISRLKLAWVGTVLLACAFFLFPMMLFVLDPVHITWRDKAYLSTSWSSISTLLISSLFPAITLPVAGCAIYSALYRSTERDRPD